MMFAALPPSSSVSFLPRAGELALDRLADLGRAGERDLVDVGVLDERGAGAAVAGDDVDDARAAARPGGGRREEERRQRGRLGRLEDDGVARRERGRDLPGQHEQREVPRDDLAGDADGPRPAVRERVLELVRPAGVVEEVRRGEREVDVARLLDRLAAVERLEDGELARALLQDARDRGRGISRARAGERRPAVRVGRAGGPNGADRRPPARPSATSASGSSSRGRRCRVNSPERGSTHSPPTKRP